MRRAIKNKISIDSYVARYTAESYILNPGTGRGLEPMIDSNNLDSLQRELTRIQGANGGEHHGEYHLPDVRNSAGGHWHLSRLFDLRRQLKDIETKFKIYQKAMVNAGNAKPNTYPEEMAEEHAVVTAKIKVCEAEIEKLNSLIRPLLEVKAEAESAILPRRQWNICETDEDGILTKIGGMLCSRQDPEDDTSILVIRDERSPFDGMFVWRFKAQILGAIVRETSYRQNTERKLAVKEGRPAQPIPHVATPIFNADTQSIEYPGYSNSVLKKIKQL